LERVKKIGFDTSRCGCILRQTYGLPCACELARYDPGMIPLQIIPSYVKASNWSLMSIIAEITRPVT